MAEDLTNLMDSSRRTIAFAQTLVQACREKEAGKYSHSGSAVSFFVTRGSEMFESFLILVEKERIFDCALILRSFLDMGMTLAYIFSADIGKRESEKRAYAYLIEGNRDQLRLANSNQNEFRRTGTDLGKRIDELKRQLEDLETAFASKYKNEKPKFPQKIEQRAILAKYEVIRKVYDQAYRILSFIDHHSFFIGQNYINMDRCEPLIDIDNLKHHPQLRLGVSLLFFKSLFIEMLSVFNDVYHLGGKKQISEFRALQIAEMDSLKKK